MCWTVWVMTHTVGVFLAMWLVMYGLQEAISAPRNNLPAGHFSERTNSSSIHLPPGRIFADGHGVSGPGECGAIMLERRLLGGGVVVISDPGTSTVTFLLHISNRGRNVI